ncbi:MAG: immunity 70 family protein [Lachnospiraceae bacterium]|nr:immunity 70 family protein [Lachnospiraceae bacterium]
MAVGFKVKYYWYQIGNGDFLHSFFSTVAYHLENKSWGSRFPLLMNELYQGKLDKTNINKAIEELDTIQTELQRFEPNQVIWDIDDLSKQPPWGNNISKEITNLSNYFVTSEGADFISVFFRALRKANEVNAEIEIKSI